MDQKAIPKQNSTLRSIAEFVGILVIIFLVRTFGFGLYQVPTCSMETTMLVGERFFADKFTPLFSKPKAGDIIAFNDPLFPYSKNRVKRFFQEYFWGPTNWTKRVIAVPGQDIRGTVENGKPVIYIDGKLKVEPYVNKYPLIEVKAIGARGIARQYVPMSYDPDLPLDKQPFYNVDVQDLKIGRNGEIGMCMPGTPLPLGHNVTPEMIASLGDKNYFTGSDYFHYKLGKDEYWAMGDNRLGSQDCRFFGPIPERLIHGKIVWRLFSMQPKHDWMIIDLIKHPLNFWSRIRWNRIWQGVK